MRNNGKSRGRQGEITLCITWVVKKKKKIKQKTKLKLDFPVY